MDKLSNIWKFICRRKYFITIVAFTVIIVFLDENSMIRRLEYKHEIMQLKEEIEKYVNENREEFAEEIRKQLKSVDFKKNITASFLQAIVKCTESEWKMPVAISFDRLKEDDY